MTRNLHYGITEQAKAGKHRLDDALVLLNAARWRGAMYLAGYAVECLLKTKLMRMFGCRHLRELEEELKSRKQLPRDATIYSHQLIQLLRLTGRADALRQNAESWKMFNIVNRWIPAWRYSPDLSNRHDAQDFVEAVEQVIQWIDRNI